jgi:hypothetical protein
MIELKDEDLPMGHTYGKAAKKMYGDPKLAKGAAALLSTAKEIVRPVKPTPGRGRAADAR